MEARRLGGSEDRMKNKPSIILLFFRAS
jgi:hypothetical protein